MKPNTRRFWFSARTWLQITGACFIAVLGVAAFLYGILSYIHWLAN